jgi:hypothetical protein
LTTILLPLQENNLINAFLKSNKALFLLLKKQNGRFDSISSIFIEECSIPSKQRYLSNEIDWNNRLIMESSLRDPISV